MGVQHIVSLVTMALHLAPHVWYLHPKPTEACRRPAETSGAQRAIAEAG